MGGTIQVESTVGEGSRFWFEISLPVESQTQQSEPIPLDVTNAFVLVVDDNAVNRSIIKEQLTAWKFKNAAVSSGSQALTFLEDARRESAPYQDALEAIADELKDCPSGVILDYEVNGEHIQLTKTWRSYKIDVDTDDTEVHVKMPARLMSRALDIL